MPLADVRHLLAHRFRAVIAPEIVVVPNGAGGGLFVIFAIDHTCQIFKFTIAPPGCRRTRSALVQAVIRVLHPGPSFAIKRNAENNLVRRYSSGKKTANGIVAKAYVERWPGRIMRIVEQRAM